MFIGQQKLNLYAGLINIIHSTRFFFITTFLKFDREKRAELKVPVSTYPSFSLVFIAGYHHSPWRKLWPSAHFCHARVHSSLITPFRWYKLGLSRTVSVMDYRGQYETHWSISWISSWVSRQLCEPVLTHSQRRGRILPRFSATA